MIQVGVEVYAELSKNNFFLSGLIDHIDLTLLGRNIKDGVGSENRTEHSFEEGANFMSFTHQRRELVL